MPITEFPEALGQGPEGAVGAAGGWSLLYDFSTSTSAPPATGQVRYNNATPSSVTHIYVHETDRVGGNLSAVLSEIAVDDEIRLFRESGSAEYAFFRISAISDAGSYRDFTVVHLSSNGTFLDLENIGLGFAMRGPAGGWTIFYSFSTSTSTPPSSGQIRYNNATPSSVTHIYVHETNRTGTDVAAVLGELASGDELRIFRETSVADFAHFRITAISDAGSYRDYTVVYLSGSGTFPDTSAIGLSFSLRGSSSNLTAQAEDNSSGNYTTTATYSSWSASILSLNITTTIVADVLIFVNGRSLATSGSGFHDGAILGVAMDSGSKVVVCGTTNSGLGDGRGAFIGGVVRFSAVSIGSHTFDLHLTTGFSLNTPAAVMRQAEAPLRMVAHYH